MEEKPGYTRLPNGNWMTPYGEQGESGFDISLLRETLKLTPTERVQKLQRSLILVQEVRRAGRNHRLSQRSGSSE